MEEKKLTLREARDTICNLANATEETENFIIFGYGMGLSTALDLIDKIQEPERISDSAKTDTCAFITHCVDVAAHGRQYCCSRCKELIFASYEQIRKRSIFCSNCGAKVEELL